MSVLLQILGSLPMLLLNICIEYRLLNRTLNRQYSQHITLFVMLLFNLLIGWLNLNYALVGTTLGNSFYYGTLSYLLYLALFRGGAIKIAFFNVLLLCSSGISFYIPFPLCYILLNNNMERIASVIRPMGYLSIFLCGVLLEYVARKFQNLRYELPIGYTIYLMVVMLFIFCAVYAMFDLSLVMGDGILTVFSAIKCFMFAVVGTGMIIFAIFAIDQRINALLNEQQRTLQTAHFQSQQVQWQQLVRFRHDLKNHLICLNSLLAQGKIGQVQTYMNTLLHTAVQMENLVQTGNDYADALLSAKYVEAEVQKISLSIEMQLPAAEFSEPMDLCCILSNAMDNAIEACLRVSPNEKRWITARSFIRQGQLVIEIKNTLPAGITVRDGRIFPFRRGSRHGYGLENIRAAVKKHEGVLDLSADGCFTLSVLLPINRS